MLETLRELLDSALASGSLAAYGLAFAGGVAASFTPCTYPVLPLTVGYLGHAAGGRRGRAILLALAMTTGMALVYAVLGIVLTLLGKPFGSLAGNGWAMFAVALFFVAMSLFLLDVFTFPTPKFLQRLRASPGSRREGVLGAFVAGGVSGLAVGPCTGPILGVVLAASAASLKDAEGASLLLHALKGGLLLFLFGFGQGALIVLCGAFAGLLSRLPRAGAWMERLKKGFAIVILAGACLLLVHVGQATDFPDLTRAFASLGGGAPTDQNSPRPAPTTSGAAGSTSSPFGGDEFLK